MPQITFTVSTEDLARLVDAYCGEHGYDPAIVVVEPDPKTGELISVQKPNPETRAAFTRRMIGKQIMGTLHRYETDRARRAAEKAVNPITLTD